MIKRIVISSTVAQDKHTRKSKKGALLKKVVFMGIGVIHGKA